MLETMTFEKLMERMLSRVSDKLDKREGSIIYDALAPAAVELTHLYIELGQILKEVYADTASREYLERRAKERGITPKPATQTVLECRAEPSNVDILGKRFNLNENNYIVTEKTGDGTYKVVCESAGEIGNRYTGAMVPVDYVQNLQSATLTRILIHGENEEDTERLRERYFRSFKNQAFGGNRQDYKNKVLSIQGVGAVKVIPVWNADIKPSEMIPSGDVDSWVLTQQSNQTVRDWLNKVHTAAKDKMLTVGGAVKIVILDASFKAANSELIQKVQNELDPLGMSGEGMGLAPIGHVVTVSTAGESRINVNANLTLAGGYTTEGVRTSVQEEIEEYFAELRREWADFQKIIVRISQIETRILKVPGVIDIEGTTLNNGAVNLEVPDTLIPMLGKVLG